MIDAFDVDVSHAPVPLNAAAAAPEAGDIAARLEEQKRSDYSREMPGSAAIGIVLSAVEACGRIGLTTLKLSADVGDVAPACECISKGAFVRWVMQLLLLCFRYVTQVRVGALSAAGDAGYTYT